MKIYTNAFDLTTPSQKKVWTPQHSDYAIGVKVTKDGIAQDNAGLSVYEGGTMLSAENTEIAGNKIYKMSSGDPSTKTLDVKYFNSENLSDTVVFGFDGTTITSKQIQFTPKVDINVSADTSWICNGTGNPSSLKFYDENGTQLNWTVEDGTTKGYGSWVTIGDYTGWGYDNRGTLKYATIVLSANHKYKATVNRGNTSYYTTTEISAVMPAGVGTTQGNFKLNVEATDTTVYDIDEKGATFNLPIATETTLGGVKFDPENGIKVDGEGILALATASDTGMGGIKVGANLSIDMNTGVLSAIVPQIQTVTESEWITLSASAVNGKLYFVTPDAE